MIQRSPVHIFEADGILGTKTVARIVNHDGSIGFSQYNGFA